jgi:hypothetical protein
MLDTRGSIDNAELIARHPETCSAYWLAGGTTFYVTDLPSGTTPAVVASLEAWTKTILASQLASHDAEVTLTVQGDNGFMAGLHVIMAPTDDLDAIIEKLAAWATGQGYTIEFFSVGSRPALPFEVPTT